MLNKLCPRCGKLIDYKLKYCEKCASNYKQLKANRDKEYDSNVRTSDDNIKYFRFYKSRQWKQLVDYVRIKYNNICLYNLLVNNTIVRADVVHHIEFLKDNWDRRLDITNLIPLSHAAHNMIHNSDKEEMKILLFNLLEKYKNKYQ